MRQALPAFYNYGEGLKELEILEHHVIAVREDFTPVSAARGVRWRSHQAERSGGVIHPQVPESVPMVSVILDVLAPRFDQRPGATGIIRGKKLLFTRGVA